MLFLSKLIPVFVLPLGLAILLGVIALLMSRWRRAAALLAGLAVGLLWVSSAPVFANWLNARLELAYPPQPIDEVPNADVVIVLGGIVDQRAPSPGQPDLGDPVDRVLDAWRLFRAGKVSAIVVSGGNLPWVTAIAPEAQLIKDLLVELGVPEAAVVAESNSRNTHENAINTAAVLRDRGWRSALLVTSGTHMPRAVAAFHHAGVDVIPAATDLHARSPLADSVLDYLPDADALVRTSVALREWLGLLYYRVRGWA